MPVGVENKAAVLTQNVQNEKQGAFASFQNEYFDQSVQNKAAHSSSQSSYGAGDYGTRHEYINRDENRPFEESAGATSYNNGATTNFNSLHSVRYSVQPSDSQMPQQSHFETQHNARSPVVHNPALRTQQDFEVNTPCSRSNLHPSLQHHTNQLSMQESIPPSVRQNLSTGTQKQYASPPGTVLHSTDPSVFKVNAVYYMPYEKGLFKESRQWGRFSC